MVIVPTTKQDIASGKWHWFIHTNDGDLLATSPFYDSEKAARIKLNFMFELMIDEYYRNMCYDRGITLASDTGDDQ